MSKFGYKNIKNSSIYVTPNFPVISTKRYKFSLFRALGFFFFFSLFWIVVTTAIIFFSPVRGIVLMLEKERFEQQAAKIQELEDKIVYFQRELESIVSTNRKLKYAYLLGTTDTIDSNSVIYDSLRAHPDTNITAGGNVLVVFKDFIKKYFNVNADTNLFFIEPSDGFIINDFDPTKGHLGIDYSVKKGSPIYAVAGGIVLVSTYSDADGNWMMINHDNNYISIYKHCSMLLKSGKEVVSQGEMIALSGNSGSNTTGPHLHFELWENGKAINPNKVLNISRERN